MPNKAHRAAARQAQTRSRRRRGKGRIQEFDQGPSESATAAAVREAPDMEAEEPESAPATRLSTPQPARRASRRSGGAEPIPAYSFLGAELKQIGIMTTLIVAILVVLTFTLR